MNLIDRKPKTWEGKWFQNINTRQRYKVVGVQNCWVQYQEPGQHIRTLHYTQFRKLFVAADAVPSM